MGSTGVGSAPVAASKQRLAATRGLTAHWGGKGAAVALLKAENLHVLPRNGESASLLFTRAGCGWIAKLSFQADDDMDDSAAVEEFVSRHLAAFAEAVPFVMHCVASHTLLNVVPRLGRGLRAHLRAMRKLKDGIHPNPTGYLVLSERGTGLTMANFVRWVMHPNSRASHPPPTMQDLEAVSLQLVYCVAALERLGVVHNDLHLDNILIEHLADDVQFTLRDRPGATRRRPRGDPMPSTPTPSPSRRPPTPSSATLASPSRPPKVTRSPSTSSPCCW